jgi:hypothetical protein
MIAQRAVRQETTPKARWHPTATEEESVKNVNLPDDELTAYSAEHLLYELQYLKLTAGLLAGENPGHLRSILLSRLRFTCET